MLGVKLGIYASDVPAAGTKSARDRQGRVSNGAWMPLMWLNNPSGIFTTTYAAEVLWNAA